VHEVSVSRFPRLSHRSYFFSELTIETGKSSVVPTITVDDIDGPNAADAPDDHDDTPQPPGAIVAASGAIPDWYKVGWRQASGIDAAPLAEGEEQDKGVLDMFLAEQFYGTWYHNAALIVFVGQTATCRYAN
jgi:hypothetical protein